MCVCVCDSVERSQPVMIVQETGVLKPYVLMHHAVAIFSWLRSGVTCAAGIAESFCRAVHLVGSQNPIFGKQK